MGSRPLVILLLALAACSPSSTSPGSSSTASGSLGTTAAASSPSVPATVSPIPTSFLVMVGYSGGTLTKSPDQQTVSLVDRDGHVVASTTSPIENLEEVPFPFFGLPTAQVRSRLFGVGGICCGLPLAVPCQHGCVRLPELITTDHRVYFVSGQDDLLYLGADGTTGLAAKLPNVKGRTQSVVAVSPDDKRISLAVFDWSQPPMKVTIYVEDLGGGNRVQIFNSTSVYEWPVGWHAGLLVVAVGEVTVGYFGPNPYKALAYHVVDSTNGVRRAELGSSTCRVVGPLVHAGTACTGPCGIDFCVSAVDWTGQSHVLYRYKDPNRKGDWAPLSPDGHAVVITEGEVGPGYPVTYVVRDDGSQVKLPGPVANQDVWWLDWDTVVLGGPSFVSPDLYRINLYRLSTDAVIPIDSPGSGVGVVPGLS